MYNARKTDPQTSKDAMAAAKGAGNILESKIIHALKTSAEGLTSVELSLKADIAANNSSTLMSGLQQQGTIHLSGYARKNPTTNTFAQVYVSDGFIGQAQKNMLQTRIENKDERVKVMPKTEKVTYTAYALVLNKEIVSLFFDKSMADDLAKTNDAYEVVKMTKTVRYQQKGKNNA